MQSDQFKAVNIDDITHKNVQNASWIFDIKPSDIRNS